jgi:hypothetical protein
MCDMLSEQVNGYVYSTAVWFVSCVIVYTNSLLDLMFDVLGVGKGSALGSCKKDICDILTFLKFPTFFSKYSNGPIH